MARQTDLRVGRVVASPTEAGLRIRRRPFTSPATLAWLFSAVTLGAGVLGATRAPIAFTLVWIVVLPMLALAVIWTAAERSGGWVHRIVHRHLDVANPRSRGSGDYREAPRAAPEVVIDGRRWPDVAKDVFVSIRKAERGDAKAYAVYLRGEYGVVEVTVTSDAEAARDLRQLLRDALGLERVAHQPEVAPISLAAGCWMVLGVLALTLGTGGLAIRATLSATTGTAARLAQFGTAAALILLAAAALTALLTLALAKLVRSSVVETFHVVRRE